MIRRRAMQAGIKTRIGNHTFRATGITQYLRSVGRRELAQPMAAHELQRTTAGIVRDDSRTLLATHGAPSNANQKRFAPSGVPTDTRRGSVDGAAARTTPP